jgi:hypothetical protein
MFRLHLTSGGGSIDRSGPLTPYAVETILEDARRAGAGALLELGLSSNADVACLAGAHRDLARLAARGVYVRVRRDPELDRAARVKRTAA